MHKIFAINKIPRFMPCHQLVSWFQNDAKYCFMRKASPRNLDAVNSLRAFKNQDLTSILHAQQLNELAPLRFKVPSGPSTAINYSDSPPVLAVKLQEMFGCQQTPAIANGKLPLLEHLLSPAGRPLPQTSVAG